MTPKPTAAEEREYLALLKTIVDQTWAMIDAGMRQVALPPGALEPHMLAMFSALYLRAARDSALTKAEAAQYIEDMWERTDSGVGTSAIEGLMNRVGETLKEKP